MTTKSRLAPAAAEVLQTLSVPNPAVPEPQQPTPSPAVPEPQQPTPQDILAQAAVAIGPASAAYSEAFRKSLEPARRLGEILQAVFVAAPKTAITYTQWVAEHSDYSRRQADNFREIFRNWDRVQDCTTQEQVKEVLRGPRQPMTEAAVASRAKRKVERLLDARKTLLQAAAKKLKVSADKLRTVIVDLMA